MGEETTRFYEFGPFRIDAAERMLLRDGQPVPLTPKAFDALLLFVESGGRTIETNDLMNKLWPESFVEEGNLKVTIFKLRKALGESSDREQYIETIPKRGYRFVAPVKQSEEPGIRLVVEKLTTSRVLIEQEEEKIEQPADAVSRRFTPKKKALAVVALVATLGAAIVCYEVLRGTNRAEVNRAPQSIAVLPFKLLTAAEGDEYFGLGVADTLITKLSSLSQVIVRSTSAVRRYTDNEQDPVEAGRELGVDSVIEGSIQRSGERIRLTVRLVNVRDGRPLWAGKFDEEFKDIFKVQDSISEKVAAALTLKLNGEDKSLLTKRYTENAEAYKLYLKGRYHWNKRSPEGTKKGIECFEQATVLDPNYALAYAGLADSYSVLGNDYYLKAKASAVRALEIDEQLAEAHTSLGLLKMRHEWDWPGANKELQRAIELNPNYATAHQWYSICLELMGRPDEAVTEAKRAQELDPLSLIINTSFGDRLFFAGRYDQAIEQLRSTIEIDPNFIDSRGSLGEVYLQQKLYDQAITEFQRAKQAENTAWASAKIGQVYAMSGKTADARRIIAELEEQLKRGAASPDYIAGIYARLGEKEQALAWLERAYEARSDLLVFIKVDPTWDTVRSDARFQDLLRRIGLQ
jgi:TolB-like protein/DNA-binding winged helix-turn-helix (wHTH) protein/Tfp pilus assembly protein PilF